MSEPVARRPHVPDRYEYPRDPEGVLPWSYAVRLVPDPVEAAPTKPRP